jgi:protein O-GlcNAc transferase
MGFFDRFRSASKTTASSHPAGAEASDENSMRLIDEGNALESAGKVDEAMQCYETASRLTPNLARAHLNRGNIYLMKGDTDGAVDAYRTAISKDPDYSSAHFNLGNAYLQAGNPKQAQTAYEKAIALKPDFTDAYVALGCAQEDIGKQDKALENYRKALELNPDYSEVHYNLGNALKASGLHDEAVESYCRALEINPDYFEALVSLTNTLVAAGKFVELVASIRLLLEKRPDSAEVHNNLGIALKAAGQLDEAMASHRKALALKPDFADAHLNIGRCLQAQGKHRDAIANYRKAIEINPELIEAYSVLGNALIDLRQPDQAATVFRHALDIRPDLAGTHCNLGNALLKLGQLDTAKECFLKALEIEPDSTGNHNNLGGVLNNLGQLDSAIASYRKALDIDPDNYQALSNLGITLQQAGRLEEALDCLHSALEIKPDYAEAEINLSTTYASLGQLDKALPCLRRAMNFMPENSEAHSTLLFLHNYLDDESASELLEEAKRYGNLVAQKACRPYTTWNNLPNPDRCLRIGLVSGDFRKHPVGFFLDGVLSALKDNATDRLTLFAYSNSFHNDTLTEKFKTTCDNWHSVLGIGDESVCKKIREDGIDILIDVSGHTLYSRLPMFAWKPAPVQVTWLGYFATTGVAAIDYLLADPWTLPESEEVNFTEKIIRLPETRLCFTPPEDLVETASLPALSNGYITFGCFNTLPKMNDAVVELWSKVLKVVPNSKLFLMANQLREASVKQETTKRFLDHGIDGERLILKGGVPRGDYLATYNQIDICLDPFPYCGGTTTVEALWMGVPVLTLGGEHFLSRQGIGLLMNAGLSEWVATNRGDYLHRAVAHAGDLQKLASLREGMRNQVLASPIFDAPRFANHFEAALRSMWRDWCKEQTG